MPGCRSLASLSLAFALTAPVIAQTRVTSFAPSTNTTPGVWFESDIRFAGTAAVVDLTGLGGDLETNQPLPTGGARLTTTGDTADKAEVGVGDSYGQPQDIFATLSISYAYHKATNAGQNAFAAPSLKLAFFNPVCDDGGSGGDCFGTLVYEPTWNQPGFEGSSTAPPLDTWTTVTVDENNGLFWWTGGFGQPNTAGGPPLRTLADWRAIFTSDFEDAELVLVSIGVGTFNTDQIGYFDDVSIAHGAGPGFSASYDFETPVVKNNDTGEEFALIQDAIDDADTLNGHVLEMLVPDHSEGPQIVFSKSLTLQGASPNTLRPTGDTGTSGDARAWILTDFGTDVTFKDLIFDGSGFLVWNCIRSHGTCTVRDCDFTEIKYNESGPTYQGIAVTTFEASGPLTVLDTEFSEIGRIGIHVFGDTVVERCTYTGKGIGDFLDYFMCVGSFGTSIGIAEVEDCVVSGNRGVASSDGSTSAGILVTTFFGAGSEADISGCTLTDNSTGLFAGFDAFDTSDVVANFNNIFGNDFGVVNVSTSTVVDAKGCWWGDLGGPDDPPGSIPAVNGFCAPVADIFNANPSGDNVTDTNVCYCPWSEVLLSSPGKGSLVLSVDDCPDDALPGEPGYQIAVELSMLDLSAPTTGFQAFLEYPTASLTFRPTLSSYTSDPFPLHVQPMLTAETAPGSGMIRLDGSDALGDPGTVADALLATLIFDVAVECSVASVNFDLGQVFDSELSFEGDPIPTNLINTGPRTLDDTPPVLDPCPADIVQAADADSAGGCDGAFVSYTAPGASDNCGGTPTVDCVPASGTFFTTGVHTVTCTATDDCGNESECTFEIEVTATNVICVEVELDGVHIPSSRCIHFKTSDCNVTADVVLSFVDHDGDDGNMNGIDDATEGGTNDPSTPVRTVGATVEVDCGVYSSLCAKDEAHTQWDSSSLVLAGGGAKYETVELLSLEPGDDDNDGDVDINDLTLIVVQFGGPEPAGGCPWDGTRGADFSNNGNVGAEDYSLLSSNWLTVSSCGCSFSVNGPLVSDRRLSVKTSNLEPWIAARVDFNRDGTFDRKDVEIFERKHGLPNTISTAMRAEEKGRP